MRSRATLYLSAAVIWMSGSVAFAGPADDLSRAAVSGLGALQISGAAVGEARDDGSAVVLSNVTYSSQGNRSVGVKITRVTVTGGVGSTDALSNSRIVLEGVEGTGSDGQTYRFDRAEIGGAEGSFSAILGSLATREPFFQGASEASVTGFSAQSIAVPSMTVQRRRQSHMERAAYTNVRLNGYQRGKVAEMTIAGVVSAPEEGKPGQRVEFGQSRFVGFDTAAGTRAGNTTTVAIESGSIEQIRGTGEQNGPFSIERITFGKVSMRPGERSLVALTQTMQEIDPAANDEASRRRSIGVAAELFARLDLDRVEVSNVRSQTREGRPFTMGGFVISGVTQGKIGNIELTSMTATDEQSRRTTIGRFSIEGVDASGLVGIGKEFAEGRFNPGGPPPPAAIPDIRRIIMEEIRVTSPDSQSLGSMSRMEIEAGPRVGYVPTRLRARITGFEAPVNDARQRAQLAPLGLTDKVKLAAELEMEYVESAREVRVRTLKMDVDDVGSLALVMSIGGLERAQIEALPNSAALLGLAAKAGPIRLTFTEEGGVESLISHVASQHGVEEDALKEQLKAQAAMMIQQFIQDPGLARRIATAFGEFLDDPNSLMVSATPKGDLPLAALAVAAQGSPLALLGMFNIEVKANQ